MMKRKKKTRKIFLNQNMGLNHMVTNTITSFLVKHTFGINRFHVCFDGECYKRFKLKEMN